jgi:hypothetical protein
MAAPNLIGLPRPPLHFSQLKSMAQSPMHYQHALSVRREETRQMRLGSALDAGVFGTRNVVVYPGDRRGKAWKEFEAAHPGDIIITAKEEPQVAGMARALLSRPDALELLRGERQKTLDWTLAGRACQGTPDAFTPDRIADLKSCESSSPERFPYKARRFGWIAQLAWYVEGLVQSGHARPAKSYLVAVESTAPHPVTVFELTERALEQGTRTWRLWFERLRACEESNAWPAYAESFVPLDVPEENDSFSLTIGGEEMEIE